MVILFAAILCLEMMAVLVRVLLDTGHYNASELSAYRNVFGVIPSLLLLVYTGDLKLRGTSLRVEKTPLALFRGVVIAVAQLFFYTSLGSLELATVSALGQTNALFVVLFAVFLLGERVGIWRVASLFMGFAGAAWILRPGSDAFSWSALFPIGAAVCYAYTMVSVRQFSLSTSNALLYLYSSAGAAVGAIAIAIFTTEFSPLQSWSDAGTIFLLSMLGGCGVLFLMLAYRTAAASILAPFGYFGILVSFSFGWFFFGELPVDKLFPGVLLIVGAGIMIIWRESKEDRGR